MAATLKESNLPDTVKLEEPEEDRRGSQHPRRAADRCDCFLHLKIIIGLDEGKTAAFRRQHAADSV